MLSQGCLREGPRADRDGQRAGRRRKSHPGHHISVSDPLDALVLGNHLMGRGGRGAVPPAMRQSTGVIVPVMPGTVTHRIQSHHIAPQ